VIALVALLQMSLTVAVGGSPTSPEYLPLRVAEAEGYFNQEGLHVSLRTAGGEVRAAESLARGQASLAATSLDAALRHGAVAGRPPRLAFGLTAAPPAVLLVPAVHRDAVKQVEDLAGKRVGVPAPGSPEAWLLSALLHPRGISPVAVSLVSLGERGLAAALETAEVHAGLLADPWASRLLAEGRAVALADFRRPEEAARWLGGPTVHAALFVRPEGAPAEPELAAFARALLKAVARARATPAEALLARLPDRAVGLREDFVARLEGAREIYLPGGRVSPEAVRASLALSRQRAPLPKGVRIGRPADLLLP
jgi:NitT/TauT family transport system substrate-binding protein